MTVMGLRVGRQKGQSHSQGFFLLVIRFRWWLLPRSVRTVLNDESSRPRRCSSRSWASGNIHRSKVHVVIPIAAREADEGAVAGRAHVGRVLRGIAGVAIKHAGSGYAGAGSVIEEREGAAHPRPLVVL